MAPDLCRIHAKVRGRVQGVFFRAWIQEQAKALGAGGWIRNLPDGSVELVAEGNKSALEALLARCHHGPAGARVDGVDSEWRPAEASFGNFEILR